MGQEEEEEVEGEQNRSRESVQICEEKGKVNQKNWRNRTER